MGADSICIKDMAGLLLPYKATELVKALKEAVRSSDRASYPLYIRCCFHDIPESSRSRMLILLILQCHHLHWEHPSRQQKLWLRPSKVHHMIPDLDQELLAEIADYFRPIREDALESGLLNPKVPWRKYQDSSCIRYRAECFPT